MKEIRNIGEVNLIEDRHVSGYAIVFELESNDLGGFTEIISKDAVRNLESNDVLCLLNHNVDRGVLARYKRGTGSLQLMVDDNGLRYDFDAPDTALGNELLEGLRRGDISQSSFAFTVDKDSWEKRDGKYIRTIKSIKNLYDVSPVYHPAYDGTSVANTRGLEELKEEEIKQNKYIADLRASIPERK